MDIDLFRMERTQCLYENEVRFNLSESGVLPLSIEELLPDPESRQGLLRAPLKYPASTGRESLRRNIAEFYAHESCGQCTPCREGSLWLSKALQRLTHGGGRPDDADYLLHIARNIQGRTICAFGEACAWPVLSFVAKFRDEFEARGAQDLAHRTGKPAVVSPQPADQAH